MIHDTKTDGHLPGGLWEDLGDGKFRRLTGDAPAPAKKTKSKKRAAKAAEEAGEE